MAVSYVTKPTVEGDNWASLYAGYKHAFPSNTTLVDFTKAVCAANGIPYSTAAIEKWIFGMSGKRMPIVVNNTPAMYGGQANVGWAYFGEGNQIKLPDVQRAGTNAPKVSLPVAAVKDSNVLLWSAVAAGGLWLLVSLASDKKKKNSKQ